ncbi:NAD(P)H-dependent glycerol-3-phosphate dehydrogenase [Campylobacter insulaenigrae]|uniref:Glycerol-3-phosphate dehydrogenase [NAD(P)+] n=1 Tax=Campylobacter insulaenigrae TaxID=260714 RepID=A0ABY3G668_9BACT|nr:NAD(P)H-dependent glycerol-3-phosphate dehydrogenase [Campylobacter insulaenigrae]MCR6570708.1 NAD(P)H-dependent glycerol-3-phosphate dehydrogenase [Campylobacter insulaenigrae]MCR6572363.1 NAD(P)H-dependent glycerol-3-phosphate dehydrogenase [Campylobacter insulaenigrae]MCR6573883.1 NAD(P)H-dependent glycerol-3-phosphate dehydrogenase [Campylobacter insulaenigrae]MCR6575054.1 NAD(P)H-dependent glycerol-3-phosphate dehydrogenase [Campylobacter insulaenigrae]MCR6577392.1 NAD(P)H-dependent gl
MKIAVIGAGKWGSALYDALSVHNECVITSYHNKDIPNFVSTDIALECEYLVFALYAQGSYEWLKNNFKDCDHKILVASKGIDFKSLKFMDEIFMDFIASDRICFLSGPSFALEVLEKKPCALVISGKNKQLCSKFSSFFPKYVKTYISNDVKGAEICGAYKNVLAIASGVCDGLKLGNNARASLVSRGLVEMHRFGRYFNASEETFLGLSGAGDLFLSASSPLSRNYRVGFNLAQNKNLEQILQELGEVAEGVQTAFAIHSLAQKYQIYTPIVNEVVSMLNGKNIQKCVADLMLSKEEIQ